MTALLNWRIWCAVFLAVAFAATGWKGYVLGKKSVQEEFDAYKTVQMANALKQEEANRQKEQALQLSIGNLSNAYAKQQATNHGNAVLAANSLRDLESTIADSNPTSPDTSTPSSVNGRAGLEAQLLGDCATTLATMAGQADELEARLVGLQTYIKQVLEKQ